MAGLEVEPSAPRRRRLALRLHLLMCPHCRCYAAQIRAVGTAVRSLIRAQGENPKTLERIRRTTLSHPETTPNSGETER